MNTSYFAKYKLEHGVSISLSTPKWVKGKVYKKPAPSWELLNEYKSGLISKEEYAKTYKEEILSKLDAKTVYEELGEDAVLLCWEKSSDFCHRHLVAEWLRDELGIKISEV